MKKKYYILILIFGASVMGSLAQNKKTRVNQEVVIDPDLQIPEDLERNFDELLVDWKKDLKSQTNDCDLSSNSVQDYPDSIYINRLYSLPTEMELAYNQVVRSYIDMYSGRRKTSVSYFLGKSNYFFPIFEKYLDQYGLPLELKYLPIIESALNPTVVSRAGATGLWQFMIGTGKMYDLEINSLVDERRDPVKSSQAAAKYLRDLHNIYNDWNLVIAAYNCGPGNVNKAIRRSGGKTDYWQIYPYLPKETRGYVPAFIAATYIMNYADKHNICPSFFDYTLSTDTIHVNQQLSLEHVSKVLNVSMDELHELNPQYKKDIIPGEYKEYVLKLPSVKSVEFLAQQSAIFNDENQQYLAHRKVVDPVGVSDNLPTDSYSNARLRYKVRRGDNLSSIAKKYRITVSQIKKWNGLRSNRVNVGQVLAVGTVKKKTKKIDTSASNLASKSNTATPTNNSAEISSDAPSGLLGQYFAKIKEDSSQEQDLLSDAENLQENVTDSVGDVTEDARDDLYMASTIYHKIRSGESFDQIAQKYNISTKDLKLWNKIKSSKPHVGDRLVIYLPQKDDVNPLAEDKNQNPITSNISIYTVQRGDTLTDIAQKFGSSVSVDQIKKTNNLSSNKLKIGQKLKIPFS